MGNVGLASNSGMEEGVVSWMLCGANMGTVILHWRIEQSRGSWLLPGGEFQFIAVSCFEDMSTRMSVELQIE